MRVALHRGHGRLLRPVEHAQPPRAVQVGAHPRWLLALLQHCQQHICDHGSNTWQGCQHQSSRKAKCLSCWPPTFSSTPAVEHFHMTVPLHLCQNLQQTSVCVCSLPRATLLSSNCLRDFSICYFLLIQFVFLRANSLFGELRRH